MSALAASCTCCTVRGLLNCLLRPNTPAVARQIASGHSKRKGISMGPMASAEASYRTPKAPKLTGVRLDLSDCEGESSSQSRRFRKQNTTNKPPHNPLQQDAAAKQGKELEHVQIRSETICNAIQQYASCIAEAVKDLYNDSIRDNQLGVFLLSPAQACRNGSTYHLVGATQVIHGLTGVRSSPQNPKQQNCLSPICCHCLASSLQGIGWCRRPDQNHAAAAHLRGHSWHTRRRRRPQNCIFSSPGSLVPRTEDGSGGLGCIHFFHEPTSGFRCVLC